MWKEGRAIWIHLHSCAGLWACEGDTSRFGSRYRLGVTLGVLAKIDMRKTQFIHNSKLTIRVQLRRQIGKSRQIAGFLLFCGEGSRSIHLRTVSSLAGTGRSAADAAGIGDHDAECVLRAGALAEHQGDVAAAGTAIGAKAHVVPSTAALDDQFAGVTASAVQRPVVGLIVVIGVVAKQPAAVPARGVDATGAVAGRAEHGAFPGGDRGFACVLQCRDEIRLGDLQLVSAQ